jgi:hypothetical protein
MAWYEIINAKSDSYIADRDAEDMLRQLGTALHRMCRKTLLRQWGPLGLLLSLSGSCTWGFLPAPMSFLLTC